MAGQQAGVQPRGERLGEDWRGSVLLATQGLPGTKLMATYHPQRLKVDWGLTGIVRLDLKRVAEEPRRRTAQERFPLGRFRLVAPDSNAPRPARAVSGVFYSLKIQLQNRIKNYPKIDPKNRCLESALKPTYFSQGSCCYRCLETLP